VAILYLHALPYFFLFAIVGQVLLFHAGLAHPEWAEEQWLAAWRGAVFGVVFGLVFGFVVGLGVLVGFWLGLLPPILP
jgi:hypothetical protein